MIGDKNAIRKEMKLKREMLPAHEARSLSASAVHNFLSLPEYRNAVVVMSYIHFGNELKTDTLVQKCLEDGKRLAVPLVEETDAGRAITPCEIFSTSELKPGTFGIPEPFGRSVRRLAPDVVELAAVPGLAFDIYGNRIGYGAGFFDSFFRKSANRCLKIGLAFDFQVLDEIPYEEQDIPMDIIITDKRVIRL